MQVKKIRIIIFFITIMILSISVNAIEIKLKDEWKQGSKQYIIVKINKTFSNKTVQLMITDNQDIFIDKRTETFDNEGILSIVYQVPSNFEYDIVKVKVYLPENDEIILTEVVNIKKLKRFQRFINLILGNLFGVIPF